MDDSVYSHHTCICGYVHKVIYVNGYRETETIEGDEEFIQVRGNFTAKSPDMMYSEGKLYSITLISCPKCGTVKVFDN